MRQFILLIFTSICLIGYSQSYKLSNTDDGLIYEDLLWDKDMFSIVRIGPSSKKALKKGILKADEWHDLNKKHKMTFTKEIARFPVMYWHNYKSLGGYDSRFSVTMILVFKGYSGKDKSWSSVDVEILNMTGQTNFSSISNFNWFGDDAYKDFIKALDGINSDVDSVFK